MSPIVVEQSLLLSACPYIYKPIPHHR